jgi:exodeoxyribonuclease-5
VKVAVASFEKIKRSEDQEEAWKKFIKWVNTEQTQEFRLGGLAGTGKTTLIKSMRDQMGSCEVITPTAKAADVLNKKGVPAKTSHSLLCNFEHETTDDKGRVVPVFSDKRIKRDFLIVDEASMITSEMRSKILRCANRVVWVGDYGQLPPVEFNGSGQCVVDENLLDAKLTMQHRHSGALKIAEFANYLRDGKDPKKWDKNSEQVCVDPDGVEGTYIVEFCVYNNLWPVICYTNSFIQSFNSLVRRVNGISSGFGKGLKIVCCRNNFIHGICNGEMFTVDSVSGNRIKTECGKSFPASFSSKDRSSVYVQDGYAVTCHKAQGSEWPKIAVIEDIPASPKWRYTAATRAQSFVCYFTNDES